MAVPVSERPTISVLICTKNRRADVARALASLRADGVDREGVEIVVIEETAEPAPISGVRYVTVPPEGRGFAHVRNLAVQTAKGSVLVFVDDDCEVERGWFDALLAPLLADPAVGGAAGAVMVRDCNAIGYAESILDMANATFSPVRHRANTWPRSTPSRAPRFKATIWF